MSKVRFAEFEFDAASYRLSGREGVVPLEPKVAELLTLLIQHRKRVISRRDIFEALWPNQDIGDAALSRLLYELRKALRDEADNPRFIRTVPRRGIQFTGTLEAEPQRDARQRPGKRRQLALTALLLTVILTGFVVSRYLGTPDAGSTTDQESKPATVRIAILSGVAAGLGSDAGMVLVTVGDLLWNRLASVPGIEVRSPFFSDALSAAAPSVAAFGRDSQVDYVLSLTAAPSSSVNVVSLHAELIQMKGDTEPWRTPMRPIELPLPSSDEDLARFLETRELLVEAVTEEIGTFVRGPGSDSAPHSVEAWRMYLLARGELANLTCGTAGARGLLERVVELDPEFALGWVMLGLAHYNEAWACGAGRESALKALAASQKAAELEPGSAGAVFLEVSILTELGQAESAEQIARDQLATHPNAPATMVALAYSLTYQGRLEEAATMINSALAADSLVLAVETGVTPTVFLHQGDWQRYLDVAPAGDGPIERYYRAYAHWRAGNEKRARELLAPCVAAAATDRFTTFCEALSKLLSAETEQAQTLLLALQIDRQSERAMDGEIDFKIAQLLAQVGALEAASASARASWARGFRCRPCYTNDPLLASVRNSEALSSQFSAIYAETAAP